MTVVWYDTAPRYIPGKGWFFNRRQISPYAAEVLCRRAKVPFRRPDPGFRSLQWILTADIAGTDYVDGIEEKLSGLKCGDELMLSREGTNKYDENAVLVLLDGSKLGYIPRSVNAVIANMLRRDVELVCKVSSVASDGRHAEVCVFLPSDAPPAYLHFDSGDGVRVMDMPYGREYLKKIRFLDMDKGTWRREFTEDELWHLQWGVPVPSWGKWGLICDENGVLYMFSNLGGFCIAKIAVGKDGENAIEYVRPNCHGSEKETAYEEGLAETRKILDIWFDEWTRPIEMSLERMPCGVQGNIVLRDHNSR